MKLLANFNRRCRRGSFWLLALLLFSAASAQPANMLGNAVFAGAAGPGIAPGWQDNSAWADVAVKYSLLENGPGRTVQKIECPVFRAGAIQFVQPGVSVQKNRAYRLAVRMKGSVGSPVEIILRKKGKPYSSYISRAFKVSEEWREYSFTGISPVSDSLAMLMIRFTDTGTLFLARAELFDITDTIAELPPAQKNLLANGGFEVGLDRWGVQIREAGSAADAMAIDLLDPQPEIVTGGAAEGKKFLRVDLPETGLLRITSPYVEVAAGNIYTVSCWMAAESPRQVSIGLGGGYFRNGRQIKKTFPVSSRWRRLSFSAPLPPAPENSYYFIMESSGKGALDLDGVSLQPGNMADYLPASPVELGFARENTKTIFYQDDDIKLKIHLANYSAKKAEVNVRYTDFRGESRPLSTFQLTGAAENELWVSMPSSRTGYFRLSAEVAIAGKTQDIAEMAIGIVPQPFPGPEPNSPFGAHAKFNKQMLEYARMLGVKWLRLHPPHGTKWFVVEKEKGNFAFNDQPVLMAREKGFHILGLLASSPRWASSAPADAISEAVGSFRSYPPADLKDWRNYVYQTVKHYQGIIDHWEVWNEPDTGFLQVTGLQILSDKKAAVYSRLLREADAAARQANPEAVIVGGCASHAPPAAWTKKIFKEGALAHLDRLSFHRYTDGRPGDVLAVTTSSYIKDLNALMRTYGGGLLKPIWETESGLMYPATNFTNIKEVSPGYAVPAGDGPAYLVRNYLHLLAGGVQKWFYYHMLISGRSDRREGSGFFEWDGSPRPLAVAYAILAKTISGCRFAKSLTADPLLTGVVFRGQDKKITILWQKDFSAKSPFFFPVAEKEGGRFIDIMGNPINPVDHNGRPHLPITRNPVYIIEEQDLNP